MANSPNAGFNLQVTGSNNGTWGSINNGNFSIADGLYGGRVTVNCAGSSNITVSASQAQNFFQILTGALTGNILYILPATGGQFFIINNTTGAYTVTVVNNASGTGITVSQGSQQYVASQPDNTTVYGVIPSALSLTSLSVSGQITSTQTTGTAPFVVASTTPVANLSIGGNAATVTTNANLTGPITSTGNAVTALTAHNVLLGAGSSAIAYAPPVTAGYVLTDNGTGNNPTFKALPSSGVSIINQQVFTSNGTYTPTAGLIYAIVKMVGGGASGGGIASTTTGDAATGGGGGGGQYAESTLTAATIGASQTVTIGNGGAAPSAGKNNGNAGGATSLGSLVIANGGSGGGGADVSTTGTAGAGGTGGTGTILVNGKSGGKGFSTNSFNSNTSSGAGGDSLLGFGAQPAIVPPSLGGVAGNAGQLYGGGGSGAAGTSTSSASAGGAGANGIVIITEYCS